jgi:AAA domain
VNETVTANEETRTQINPEEGCTGEDLITADIKPPSAIIPGLPYEYKDAVLGGAYGQGKTTFCMQLGYSIASGSSLFGLPVTRPYRVLYVDLELGKSEFQQRYRLLRESIGNPAVNKNFIYVDASPGTALGGLLKLDTKNGLMEFNKLIRKHEAEVVIVDNLSLAVVGNLENGKDCIEIRHGVSLLRGDNSPALCFVHPTHVTKPNPEWAPDLLREPRQWLGSIRGSGKLLDHFTVRLGLDTAKDSEEWYVLNAISSHGRISAICLERVEQENDGPILFRLHSDADIRLRGVLTETERNIWYELPEYFTWSTIEGLGSKRASGHRALHKAKANKLVVPDGKGYRKVV